jgi:hypothetical protein
MYFSKVQEGIAVEVALQWCGDSFSDTLVGFANSIRTGDGGTHLDGLKAALTRTVNTLGEQQSHLTEHSFPDRQCSEACLHAGYSSLWLTHACDNKQGYRSTLQHVLNAQLCAQSGHIHDQYMCA